MKVVALFAVVCGCLFIAGFLFTEKLKLTVREDKATGLSVVVTLPNVKPEDRWIELYGCSAELVDDAGFRCLDDGWSRRSTQEPRADQRQYVFPWGKYVPRGPLILMAVVYDEQRSVRVSGETRVLR